jgi:hypothetical protein
MKRVMMAVAALGLWMADPPTANAQPEGPWCMHMVVGRDDVVKRCDLPSYEACRAEMNGLPGTSCTQNPYYWWGRRNQPNWWLQTSEPAPPVVRHRVKKRRLRHHS